MRRNGRLSHRRAVLRRRNSRRDASSVWGERSRYTLLLLLLLEWLGLQLLGRLLLGWLRLLGLLGLLELRPLRWLRWL